MSIAQWQLKLDHIVNVGGASSTNKEKVNFTSGDSIVPGTKNSELGFNG